MKSKILIISCVFPPEPVVSARISEAIASQLSDSEEVVVLCPKPTRPYGCLWVREDVNYIKFDVVTLPSYTCAKSSIVGRFRESFSFGMLVRKYINAHHNEIKAIYANSHPTFGQYLPINEAKRFGIPFIVHIQDVYPESLTSKLGLIGKIINPLLVSVDGKFLKKATKVVAISPSMKTSLSSSRNIAPSNIEVVYNWQDESLFDCLPPKEHDDSKFTFMYVGNIGPTANIPNVIKAFIKADLKNAQLIISGNGSDLEICKGVAKESNSKIIFTEVFPDKVPELQNRADILILPLKKGISKTAMPSKIPAYMFSAKPIIAWLERNSDAGNAILESECGWVVEPEDINALVNAMKDASNADSKVLSEMGKKGRNFGLQKYSQKSNLKKICGIIKSY